MTDYQENQREQAELYVDHFDEIQTVQDAFNDRWNEYANSWGRRLATALESAELIADHDEPRSYAEVAIETEPGKSRDWIFRHGTDDWSWIFPGEWWTKLDERRPIVQSSKPNGRVGFLHRLGQHREEAIGEKRLIFYLRNAPSGHSDFYDSFAKQFNADDDIPSLLPAATSRPGRKSNVLEASYPINLESDDDFFEAYNAALAQAMQDHVVSNEALVNKIDTLYEVARNTYEEQN